MIIDETYVYLIAHKDAEGGIRGPIKVGYSASPEKRLSSLQTGNPSSLELVFNFVTPTGGHARDAESTFHEVCKEHRLSGEWFDMEPPAALATLTKCLMAHIGMDIHDAHDLAMVMEWCGVGRAIERFTLLSEPKK